MAEEKQHIRLHVYDTDMSAYIMREEEKLYRDAAKLITDKINNYAGRFKGRKSASLFFTYAYLLRSAKLALTRY